MIRSLCVMRPESPGSVVPDVTHSFPPLQNGSGGPIPSAFPAVRPDLDGSVCQISPRDGQRSLQGH